VRRGEAPDPLSRERGALAGESARQLADLFECARELLVVKDARGRDRVEVDAATVAVLFLEGGEVAGDCLPVVGGWLLAQLWVDAESIAPVGAAVCGESAVAGGRGRGGVDVAAVSAGDERGVKRPVGESCLRHR